MSSEPRSHFQPPPPIRTATGESSKSVSSGTMSPGSETFSPTSMSPKSATERHFFSAIATKVRESRSRSRSRNGKARETSPPPIVISPEPLPRKTNTAESHGSTRPQQHRHVSTPSQGTMSRSSTASRPIAATRRTSSDMWRGRHSNDWLFNGFSVTETAKDLFHMGRKSS
ncbi:hypothetical protein M011DRAFT_467747 [Sporormia fimetaria CBS 119925]|uniref:Uncharacterized protein n=1 Tax=Sporormia fimetaria CBS 119925 TaxID=1340428 RepID=A0A6A6V9L6_9PLEO|nr:hypothetical protein M011DRAFT_467747 [Sporormia fimetaria CBS 119925]